MCDRCRDAAREKYKLLGLAPPKDPGQAARDFITERTTGAEILRVVSGEPARSKTQRRRAQRVRARRENAYSA